MAAQRARLDDDVERAADTPETRKLSATRKLRGMLMNEREIEGERKRELHRVQHILGKENEIKSDGERPSDL